MVGEDIYYKLIKGYTEKQWGRKATELPAFIIKRLPLRYTFDNNYQGIPMGGYNELSGGLLEGIDIQLGVNYFKNKESLEKLASKTVFTGKIDEYYNYEFGKLEYLRLRFDHEILEIDNYQGNAVINYTEAEIPYTRILEHKHFEFGQQKNRVITKEYPLEASTSQEPYYPINDEKNNAMYFKYKKKAENDNIIFGGRLAEYKYYDMHQVIGAALAKTKNLFDI